MKYSIKNLSLAPQGLMNIELAEKNMQALQNVRAKFLKTKPFRGLTIGMALHITKETAVLIRTLLDGGACVAICSCNPLSTQDDVAAALARDGVAVYGYKGESHADYYKFLRAVIAVKPNITIDDGCDLVTEIHLKHPELIPGIIGGCEETTTGIIRLRAMEKDRALKYPIIAVNDNKTKHLMDNYYGTGQSTLDGVIRATNTLIAGKTVVVAGYGSCGKGISLRARGLGARVIVTEVDNFAALQASMDGFSVMPMGDGATDGRRAAHDGAACGHIAARLGDIFITATGDIDVITSSHVADMKSGAILANSGHFDCEINIPSIKRVTKKITRVRPFLDRYELKNGREIYICAEGRLVNLGAAEGHPSEVMSMSFCGQVLACEYLVANRGKLSAGVHELPSTIDDYIAFLQLDAMNVKIDKLTPAQKKYLSSWKSGT